LGVFLNISEFKFGVLISQNKIQGIVYLPLGIPAKLFGPDALGVQLRELVRRLSQIQYGGQAEKSH
jgi:hypothetical protein